MIKLAVDFVLNPAVSGSRLQIGTLPWNGRVLCLNELFPAADSQRLDRFAFTLIILFFAKSSLSTSHDFDSILRSRRRHGLCATRFYARIIRQPIGFFQHNPTGRFDFRPLINDVERARFALSEWLAIYFKIVHAHCLPGCACWHQLENGRGCAVLLLGRVAHQQIRRRKIRRSAENSQTRLGDLSQILQETVSGNRVVKALRHEDF